MNRPYIICHMMTALDGKITGSFMEDGYISFLGDEYDRIHEAFKAKAWMCGRVTMEENFTMGAEPELREVTKTIPRTDYIAKEDAPVYCISVDPSGKLGWPANYIEAYNGRAEAHVVEVLAESVSDGYLDFLRRMGISYIFGGQTALDFRMVVEKLKKLLGVECLLLEGGGYLNGSFMNQGLIDELSLVLCPIADGDSSTSTLFETASYLPAADPMRFQLNSVDRIGTDGLWICYKVKSEENA